MKIGITAVKLEIGVQYDKQGKAIIGFRQKSSNDIASIKQCPILPRSAEILFTQLNDVLSQLKVKKAIGHIELIFTEQLHLVNSTTEIVNRLR